MRKTFNRDVLPDALDQIGSAAVAAGTTPVLQHDSNKNARESTEKYPRDRGELNALRPEAAARLTVINAGCSPMP